MERMSKDYDIVQIPRDVGYSDLPRKMEVGKPFEINGSVYVCEKRGGEIMKICSEDSGRTGVPVLNKGFYVVRRM